jgi:drug/metabolite transporter (DMT)-like permease
MRMDERTRGSFEMAGAMAVLGTIGWFVVSAGVPVLGVVFWRCAFGGLALLVICAALGHLNKRALDSRRLWLAAIGGVAIVLNWLLLFGAYSRSSISIATAVYNTQPFILVGLGAVFLGERLTKRKVAWLTLAFTGMLLVVLDEGALGGSRSQYLLGIGMSLTAALLWAIAALIGRKLAGTPPHLIALVHTIVGLLLLGPLQTSATLPTQHLSWVLLATMGIVHTGLVYILMYGALQRLPTHLQAVFSFLYPIVAALVDALAFHQYLRPAQLAGCGIILLAVAGTNMRVSLRGWMKVGRTR